jgi:hypothetical protein
MRVKLRRCVRAAVVIAAIGGAALLEGQGTGGPAGPADFDFLVGDWRVHHRRLKPGTHEWVEFEGTVTNRPLIGGAANLEEHALDAPSGAYRAIGLRSYDAKTGEWAIWWLDGRYPSGPLGPPVKGRFENGVGRFYADYEQDGKPMRGRFLWSDITPTSARWEQASSADGGQTWAPNWIMEFRREAHPVPPAAPRADARDFDFLHGESQVHHRYLRVKDRRRDWMDAEGTVTCRALMGGAANVEEHTIQAPSGPYRAVGLRSYDAKASRWSIWWLDGRAPHDLDSPVQGRFESGVGTFYGDTTIDGRPTRVRFVWSRITATAARWEQAYSSDAGRSWDTNWVMDFRRGS